MELKTARRKRRKRQGRTFEQWIPLICCVYLFLLYPINAGAKIQISNNFTYTYNNVTGPGKDQSPLTDGFRYLTVPRVIGDGKVLGYDYYFNVGARLTDDKQKDVQTFALTTLQAGFTNNCHTINLGDTFQVFSQYSLSTSIKGVTYRFNENSAGFPAVTLVYGFANPRWDNFQGFGPTRIDALYREVAGGNINFSLFEDFTTGFSVVNSNDTNRVVLEDELNKVLSYTFDWAYTPPIGLSINGESSFADTKISPSAIIPKEQMDGYAHKMTAIKEGSENRLTIEYERVSADFNTVVGSAISDREKTKVKWKHRFKDHHSVTSGILWYRDNLDGELEVRTDHYRPEVSINSKRVFDRLFASANLSYKLDLVRQEGDDTARIDHIVNFNYRDRFGLLDSETNIGLYSSKIMETPVEKNNEFTYNTSLNTFLHVDEFIFKPSLVLGGWTSRKELTDTKDQIYEYSFGMGFDVQRLKITSDIKLGHNKLEKDNGEDSLKGFARLDICFRPEFLSKLKYDSLFLRACVNDFNFDAVERDFRETSIATGMNIEF